MGRGRLVGRWAVLLIFISACGGRAARDSDPGNTTDATPHELRPPPNIDTAICKSVELDASGSTKQQACIDCCGRTPFPSSTVYGDQCLCGKVMDSSGDRACPGTFLVYDQCFACCTSASFGIAIGPSGDVADCFCAFKFDEQVCATTVQAAAPDLACQTCCLNHGYLSSTYSNFHKAVCQCVDGS